MDLSQPHGSSINDEISKEDFPCDYSRFDDATGCRSQIWNEAVRNMVISIKVSTDVSLVTMVMHERQGIIANFSHQLHVTSHVEISSKVAANCFVRPNS